ncbi:MAG TPA: hypothetical protein VFY29_03550 [Terriglobia bacterium]|nr:hypothetical protein [Terriglobia bacterium]
MHAPEGARYDQLFLARYAALIHALSYAAALERKNFPELVDADALETYKALQATMKTLESGIYYESLPEGAARMALFRRLKATLDEVMAPRPEPGYHALRASEAIEVLGFLIFSASLEAGPRPRSRRYLDWVSSHIAPAQTGEEPSRIVLP